MRINYNVFAGQSLERLAALSDGIFGVAMTLLVLNLVVPTHSPNVSLEKDLDLLRALLSLAPSLLTYFMSFLTLGIFWLGQQTQLNHFSRSDRNLTWIHLIFLFAVTLVPFSTGLLASYITFRVALIVYWFNIFLLGVMLFISFRYAERAQLLKVEVTPEIRSATIRRIVIYQTLYAFGAVLCLINTYVSIAFIVIMQLNSVIAPRIYPLDRF